MSTAKYKFIADTIVAHCYAERKKKEAKQVHLHDEVTFSKRLDTSVPTSHFDRIGHMLQ